VSEERETESEDRDDGESARRYEPIQRYRSCNAQVDGPRSAFDQGGDGRKSKERNGLLTFTVARVWVDRPIVVLVCTHTDAAAASVAV
jgi:hypothetical protein